MKEVQGLNGSNERCGNYVTSKMKHMLHIYNKINMFEIWDLNCKKCIECKGMCDECADKAQEEAWNLEYQKNKKYYDKQDEIRRKEYACEYAGELPDEIYNMLNEDDLSEWDGDMTDIIIAYISGGSGAAFDIIADIIADIKNRRNTGRDKV